MRNGTRIYIYFTLHITFYISIFILFHAFRYKEDQARGKQMEASNILYKLQCSDDLVQNKNELFNRMLEIVKEFNMAKFYEYAMKLLKKQPDNALMKVMKENSEKKIKAIDEKVDKEKSYMGESDLLNAKLDKLREYIISCDIDSFLELSTNLGKKQITTRQTIEITIEKLWILLIYNKYDEFTALLNETRETISENGDWDQRNRLKIYDSIFYLIDSKPHKAAPLLLECLPVFTSYDVLDYDKYIFYTIICGLLTLERREYKFIYFILNNRFYKGIVSCPDVLCSTSQNELSDRVMRSFYDCQYDVFMKSLIDLNNEFKIDPILSAHTNYIIKELRIKAYNQYLLSYQSCTLKSMAEAFGISVPFLDKELARFIASNRIVAKIDMVDKIVKSCRADNKNTEYVHLLAQSDAILARIQGFTRVFNT